MGLAHVTQNIDRMQSHSVNSHRTVKHIRHASCYFDLHGGVQHRPHRQTPHVYVNKDMEDKRNCYKTVPPDDPTTQRTPDRQRAVNIHCTGYTVVVYPLDAHCFHMGKHPVPDRVKLSFVIFDILALWRSGLSVRVPGCRKLQMMA